LLNHLGGRKRIKPSAAPLKINAFLKRHRVAVIVVTILVVAAEFRRCRKCN
jgi:hypothetical protein